jgi:hypothetical protein
MYYRKGEEVRRELLDEVYKLATDTSIEWSLQLSEDGLNVYNNVAHIAKLGSICMKAETYFDTSAEEVFAFISDVKKQLEWDMMLDKVKIIEEYDSENQIVYMHFGLFLPQVLSRYFVLYRTMGKDPTNRHFILACRSIEHEKAQMGIESGILSDCAPRYESVCVCGMYE